MPRKICIRLTPMQARALFDAATHLGDDFKNYYSFMPRSYHKAFYRAMDIMREAINANPMSEPQGKT